MCDIDILVEKKYAEDIWKKLLKFGYEEHRSIAKSKFHEIKNIETFNHLPGLHSKEYMVEIHWNIFYFASDI